jgi:hypothetical protein
LIDFGTYGRSILAPTIPRAIFLKPSYLDASAQVVKPITGQKAFYNNLAD